jgi:hypothetical protein
MMCQLSILAETYSQLRIYGDYESREGLLDPLTCGECGMTLRDCKKQRC